jgi:hypothetical protein
MAAGWPDFAPPSTAISGRCRLRKNVGLFVSPEELSWPSASIKPASLLRWSLAFGHDDNSGYAHCNPQTIYGGVKGCSQFCGSMGMSRFSGIVGWSGKFRILSWQPRSLLTHKHSPFRFAVFVFGRVLCPPVRLQEAGQVVATEFIEDWLTPQTTCCRAVG